MYDSIQGRLSLREPTRVVVEASGLGYLLDVPSSTSEALPAVGSSVRLLLHLVVREDAWRLFAFATERERGVFRDLLKVNSVGPALALALLSGLGPDPLVRAVAQGDVHALTRVKGIGKKTAERLVLDLKDPWKAVAATGAAGAPGVPPPTPDGPGAEAVRALLALGLEPEEAQGRVAKVLGSATAPAPGVLSVADLVRRALRG